MILTLEEIKERSVPIAIKHGVNSLRLFGSYARNDATEESDLDFIMDDGNVNSLTKYFSLINDLEEEFKCHVDLISSISYNKEFINKIKKDMIVIYER
ncbi:MAG: nucleotidyltransferase [Methanosphaera stadtmanae]|jgi:hypothetical protein|nr:nucleotidyltransferase [Methanosphaera stadtmanae]